MSREGTLTLYAPPRQWGKVVMLFHLILNESEREKKNKKLCNGHQNLVDTSCHHQDGSEMQPGASQPGQARAT